MKDRRAILLILVIILVAGLIAAVGILSFQLGQQAATAGRVEEAIIQPTTMLATDSDRTAPPIVTNTPTLSPTLTPTRGPTATSTATPTPTPSPTPTPIVVITHVSPLGRLETAEYAMRTVIDLENEPANIWENILGTDKLTLIAEGEVVAGIDLSKVDSEDILTQGTSVKITLPAPEILYSRIDNERTSIYERKTGLFRKIDQTLESRARLLAEESLVEWAVERGIYQKAEESGRLQIENLLRSLGFTDITIEFKPEPPL